MVVIADITIPPHALGFGQAIDPDSPVRIELERIVPLQPSPFPLFWVSGDDTGEIETALRDHPHVDHVQKVTTIEERTLFEVQWASSFDGILDALLETNASVLEGSRRPDAWNFRLRFSSHEELSAFNTALTNDEIPVTLRHLYNPSPTTDRVNLSEKQLEAVLLAYRRGYFEIPRQASLSDLAAELGISDTAMSQRLRRGVATIIKENVVDDQVVQHPL